MAEASLDPGQQIDRYRTPHVIRPVVDRQVRPGETIFVCAHDSIPVYPIRNGWRHDARAITRVANLAPLGFA
jgi:hypothetical protein